MPSVKKESSNYGVIWCPLLWVTEGSHNTRGRIVKPQSWTMTRATPWDHLSSPAASKCVTAAKPLAHCFLVFRMRTRRRLLATEIVLLSTCISCSCGRFKNDRNRNPGVSLSFRIPKIWSLLVFLFHFSFSPAFTATQTSKPKWISYKYSLILNIPTPWTLEVDVVTFSASICLNVFRIPRDTALKNEGASNNATYLTHACHAFLSLYVWQKPKNIRKS